MKNQSLKYSWVLPVLMSFFVMSFVDLVGIGVDRVGSDFKLSATVAQLIPLVAFFWFFALSVPVGILQDRIGKRKMLNAGMLITALGLLTPFIIYSFPSVLLGFALLGIGNTIVQVSANPLLVDVVPGSRRASYLSFSQFVKAVGSMLGAPLAGFFAARLGDWKILFLVFGAVSLLSVLWLALTPISESKSTDKAATLKSAFSLLGNGYILFMVISIFLVVGVDVGFNSFSGQFLMNKLNIEQTLAESTRSIYFFGRMLGTFAGAILLSRLSSHKFLIWSSVFTILAVLAMVFSSSQSMALTVAFLIGLGIANIFPLVFSITVGKFPERANEISGLMMMAVSGGALIPIIMGLVTDASTVSWGMFVLAPCMVVILLAALNAAKQKDTAEQ
ncbi:sugar MFS transporter [Bacteroidota bacterium]